IQPNRIPLPRLVLKHILRAPRLLLLPEHRYRLLQEPHTHHKPPSNHCLATHSNKPQATSSNTTSTYVLIPTTTPRFPPLFPLSAPPVALGSLFAVPYLLLGTAKRIASL